MRRQRGSSLIELMAVIAVGGVATFACGAFVSAVHGEERASAAYAADLDSLRKVSRALEDDLRSGSSPDAPRWDLTGEDLRRRGEVVARRVTEFRLARRGDLVEAHVALRARTPGRPDPAVDLTVRVRAVTDKEPR